MTLANLVWTWMLGRYMLIPGGQKNPHPRRGRHLVVLLACERRHRAHISVAWRQRIVPFPSNSADPTSSHTSGVSPRFAVGHIHVVILDPDECVCHIHRSSTDLARMFGRASPRMNLIQSAAMKKISPRSTTNKRKKRTSPKDKEKELKRDYKALKEARQQSGVSWDERLCRIEAEEPIWNNLTTSNERLKKFRTKSFPLFEALGELYDGNIAEGTMNFTSIEPSRPHVTQPCQGAATQPSQAAFTLTQPSQIAFTQPSLAAFAQPSRTAFRHPSLPAFP
ncbi:uncharacterized protein [Zea mays]|uniref:uncharacterized protein isoform X2 n=1 Tax=Zea mays TaxID=4577 RepID=UPI0004DE7F82|nr:uncharacterized protein LOC103648027 isoform X2 [Zea mays]|eukprot:XP_008670751.1 uncharacterized protein LOC103648027 isoform X2 [Zea mays]